MIEAFLSQLRQLADRKPCVDCGKLRKANLRRCRWCHSEYLATKFVGFNFEDRNDGFEGKFQRREIEEHRRRVLGED